MTTKHRAFNNAHSHLALVDGVWYSGTSHRDLWSRIPAWTCTDTDCWAGRSCDGINHTYPTTPDDLATWRLLSQ